MLPDKMAIDRSNHLFVLVAFVFCLLSPLVHPSDSNDYTDSRQFKKNPAVSRYRNNTQRLPNYNWKPPDKYYDPSRKDSTEKKAGMEFTKPEDPEQRVADPWIKKMQEISRQEREKWAAYKRNENGKLALDNVEETRKASKLANDESITIPMASKSEEYDENVIESVSKNLFEGSDESLEVNGELHSASSKTLAQHSSVDQDNASVKTHKQRYLISGLKELSNKQKAVIDEGKSKVKEDRLFSSIVNSHSEESNSQQSKTQYISTSSTRRNFQKIPKRENLYHTSNPKESTSKEYSKLFNSSRNDNEKSSANSKENNEKMNLSLQKNKEEKDDVNSHHSKSISQYSKNRHIPKNSTHKNVKKLPKNAKNLNHKSDSKKLPAKEYPKQSSPSQDDDGKSNKDGKRDSEKITTAKPLTRKSKEKKDENGETEWKHATEEPLNHEGSFHPGRWGMSVSSPPVEFLKDITSRRSMHRKNVEQTEGEKDGKHYAPGRWDTSIVSSPKKSLKDISAHREHETGRLTVETGSRPSEIKGSSDDRSPASQSRQNIQTDLIEQLTAGERDKEFMETLLGKVSSGFYNFGYHRFNAWSNYPENVDLNKALFLRKLKSLVQILQSPHDIDIPMQCRMRILI